MNINIKVLIAAAGRGKRSFLPYPKTLYKIDGLPILVRIIDLLNSYDSTPTVVVSPQGLDIIDKCLQDSNKTANLVVQPEPLGMGDAVLYFLKSPSYSDAEHVILVWGDIPYLHPKTISHLVSHHLKNNNDFTFATRHVTDPYTVVTRNSEGHVKSVIESSELVNKNLYFGEREIGLFVFRCSPVFSLLNLPLSGKYSKQSGEHGFLYIIEHLVNRDFRVEALPIARAQDLISLNKMDDLIKTNIKDKYE